MSKIHFYSKRYREIVNVLFKHGFGSLIDRLGLSRLVPFHRGTMEHPVQDKPYSQPQHLRAAFEELGTTFIKMGQILSTRSDLLPPAYIAELSKLQSSVPPLAFDEMKECIQDELGEDWHMFFSSFEETPLASASIGQVYRAVLLSGERVIVKVQRPGIETKIRNDLEIIGDIAQLAQKQLRLGEIVDFTELVHQFGSSLLKELDYKHEGKNMDRIRENFRQNRKLYVPKVYWEFTTKKIIVMEEIEGYRVNEIEAMREAGIDVKLLAQHCAENLIKMILEDGFFHADLHPGNVFIREDGILALIDFGLVGELDETSRSQIVTLVLAIAEKDENKIADGLMSFDRGNHHVHDEKLKRDARVFLERYLVGTLSEINMGQAIQYLLEILYKNRIRVPGYLPLLAKTIMMSEEIGQRLDPEFNLTIFISNYAPRLYFHKMRTEWKGKLKDILALSSEAPNLLLTILRKASSDQLEIQMNVEKAEPFIRELNNMFNRLALSFLTGAIIISLALVMLIYHPEPMTSNLGWFFTAGFIVSVIFGGYIIISIWRSNKKIG